MKDRRADFGFPHGDWLETLLDASLAEDVGAGDATTAVAVAPGLAAEGWNVARPAGVVAAPPPRHGPLPGAAPARPLAATRPPRARLGQPPSSRCSRRRSQLQPVYRTDHRPRTDPLAPE